MNTKRLQPQLSRSRRDRGSVLILVVALLVLMALIGTAWISTARVDRAASIETARSTEAEILVEGVKNMTDAAIGADVSTAGALRRGTQYVATDSTVSDKFLASRLPLFLDEVAPIWNPVPPEGQYDAPVYEAGRLTRTMPSPNRGEYFLCTTTHTAMASERPGTGSPYWVKVGDYDLTSESPLENPVFWAATSDVRPPGVQFEDPRGHHPGHNQRTFMMPWALPPDSSGHRHPAFRFYRPGIGWTPLGQELMAADTDGDGQADANYFKLPVGRVNGLDWYAAVRVVDNNSAINASVASTFAPPAVGDVMGHFPTSLNLGGLLAPFDDTSKEYRRQRNQLNDATLDSLSVNDFNDDNFPQPDLAPNPLNDEAINDLRTTDTNERRRQDFKFGSAHELMWMTGGRRQRNPGIWYRDSDKRLNVMKALSAGDGTALAFRGGTLINPESMVRPGNTASALLEQLLPETLYYGVDNHPVVGNLPTNDPFYLTDLRGKFTHGNDTKNALPAGIESFARNDDWTDRWAPEVDNDPITWHNRRKLMTVSNPVSEAVPSRLVPRDVTNFAATLPGPFNVDVNYEVGDYVTQNINGTNVLFVCVNPVSADTNVAPGFDTDPPYRQPTALAFDHPGKLVSWEARPFEHVPTRASVNAGSFGQLFLGFWQTMAEPATLQRPRLATPGDAFPPESQTPFKDAFRGELFAPSLGVTRYAATEFDSPYFGTRFFPSVYGATIFTFAPYKTGTTVPGPDQHPLRMFRSPIRAVSAPAAPGFDEETPRLMTDHTMRLRAALAAVNTIDMRDSDDNVTVREISLGVTVNLGGPNRADETDDLNVYGRVRVYGHERQPFLTEVYANTDNNASGPSDEVNPMGYIAVEFHNPHPFPIDLRNCKIATIDRAPGGTAANRRSLRVSDSIPHGTLTPHLLNATSNMDPPTATYPWVVPANGFLVMENYNAGGTSPTLTPPIRPNNAAVAPAALYRPLATGLPQVGAIPGGAAPLVTNYAYVPNLHTVIDKEMVLVRPLGATVLPTQVLGTTTQALVYTDPAGGLPLAVDMAPLDSFDFTGLPTRDPAVRDEALPGQAGGGRGVRTPLPVPPTRSHAWHYARAFQPDAAAAATKAWRFVYPGRYDAHQTLDVTGGVPRPRQQGTQEAATAVPAGWDPGSDEDDPWELGNTTNPAPIIPVVTLAASPAPLTPLQRPATYFPYEYAIQLTSSPFLTGGAAGPNPVMATTGNAYPFGGFARNGDILRVPYIGSYRIKLTPYGFPPRSAPVSGVTTQVVEGAGSAAYHEVLELNSITMDSVFAEDTDPENHFNVAMTPGDPESPAITPPENIGRFTPSLRDLDVAVAGVVDDASAVYTGAGPRPIAGGGLRDEERTEGNDAWDGFEIVITDGPGKGQVRTVMDFRNKIFTVFPNWEVRPEPLVSRYILRRGSLWRMGAAPNRTVGNKWWASDVFDYLTVDSPQNDFLPAADPMSYANVTGTVPQAVSTADANAMPAITYGRMESGGAGSIGGSENLIDVNGAYANAWIEFVDGPAAGQLRQVKNYTSSGSNRTIEPTTAFSPGPVTNNVFRIFGKSEDLIGSEGLVNINTAPWKVLAQLPWAPFDPATMARNVVLYRDGDPAAGIAPHGPFRSIFDLYKVPVFKVAQNTMTGSVADPVAAQGDHSLDVNTVTGSARYAGSVRHDFEEHYLLMNRLSNMITTRSDTFTVYILVQGWRDAGDPTKVPQLVAQRRRAYTADRTGLTPVNKELSTQYLYND